MDPTVASGLPEDGGPGLFERTYTDGSRLITNVRLAGERRRPGTALIAVATGLLFLLSVGLFAVSLNAQYRYVFAVKHASAVSLIEAISLDAGMAIFSLLALGLARGGKSARIERVLILVCAVASAVMNWAASDVHSPRSVLAYVMPPIFLSVVVDRVVAVVRRHVLGETEGSPWTVFGRIALYGVRFMLAPPSTALGLRRWVLTTTPVPQATKAVAAEPHPPALPRPVWPLEVSGPIEPVRPKAKRQQRTRRVRSTGPSKTSQFLRAAADEHGNGDLSLVPLASVYTIAKDLAPKFDLHPGSARTALRKAILAAQGGGEK